MASNSSSASSRSSSSGSGSTRTLPGGAPPSGSGHLGSRRAKRSSRTSCPSRIPASSASSSHNELGVELLQAALLELLAQAPEAPPVREPALEDRDLGTALELLRTTAPGSGGFAPASGAPRRAGSRPPAQRSRFPSGREWCGERGGRGDEASRPRRRRPRPPLRRARLGRERRRRAPPDGRPWAEGERATLATVRRSANEPAPSGRPTNSVRGATTTPYRSGIAARALRERARAAATRTRRRPCGSPSRLRAPWRRTGPCRVSHSAPRSRSRRPAR